MKRASVFCFILSLLLFCSCRKTDETASSYTTTQYNLTIPRHFPQQLNIPADNPMTVEGVTLGRYLFYDGRLSGRTDPDSLMSCSTCHIQANSFVCGIDHPEFTNGHPYGLSGIPTPHFMLPLINLVWMNHGYLWNGSVTGDNPDIHSRNLEDIVWMTIVSKQEMDGDTTRTVQLLQGIPGYPELYRKAFGSSVVTMKNTARAIAQFVRTFVSAGSRFDRFLDGETELTASERKGFVLFMTEEGGDCFHCHGGDGNPLFTTNLFYNNGKDSVFADLLDRYHYTMDPSDRGAYKVPTLRNLAFTAPYMHDGRFRTLDEVIDFYSSGLVWSPSISPLMHHIATHGVQLTPNEKADLKAFLLTLTDTSFVTNPDFSKPLKLPGEK
jgi:cytochrome c peroxidase